MFEDFEEARQIIRDIMPMESRETVETVAGDWFQATQEMAAEPKPRPLPVSPYRMVRSRIIAKRRD